MVHDLFHYQSMVDDTVRKLGGYWRPLSGLARVIEELGELNELFLMEDVNKEHLGGELADLFIITASIGNQYCVNLSEEFELLGYSSKLQKLYNIDNDIVSTQEGLMRLAQQSGNIARILNHYEGDKKKKQTEKKQRLAEEVAKFNIDLIKFAKLFDIPLFFYVQQILNKDIKRDIHRFAITHDPTTEPSLEHFRTATKDTEYEKYIKLWGSFEWDYGKGLEGNLKNSLDSFNRFAKIAKNEGLDGFVLEIEDDDYFREEMKRNETIRRIFNFLNQNDPSNIEGNYGFYREDFTFTYLGESFEWIPLANDESLFILFQPI